MPADLTIRYAADGSTRGSELARAQQYLTPQERAAVGDLAEDVHSRVQETVVDDLLDRLETDR
jgi:hypothetical protein